MKDKAQIQMVEMISVVIILFVVFNIFFPHFSYRNRWQEAYTLLTGRDLILTMDRIGKLYEYTFNPNLLKSFLDYAISERSFLVWSEAEGMIKPSITIACNCSADKITLLSNWLDGLELNGRKVGFTVVSTNLDKINKPSDVLVIWGYRSLDDYRAELKNYLDSGNGIVEIMDFGAVDETQTKIFGLESDTSRGDADYDIIVKPLNTSNITYQPYKFFYHVPVPLKASGLTPTIDCSKYSTGNFTFDATNYSFWVCNRQVYFDTDEDGLSDTGPLNGRNIFSIQGYTFLLNYIYDNKIGVSFKPNYNFTDFCKITGGGTTPVKPVNDEFYRSFIYGIKITGYGPETRNHCSILNGTSTSRTAWISDFSRLANVGDEHRNLLTSLILWASNKNIAGIVLPAIKTGYATSYINVNNTDMFEVYRFDLGLGQPF